MADSNSLIRPYKEPAVTAATNTGDAEALVRSDDPLHPANVIVELCRLFYTLGWVTGTGGGISVRDNDLIYLAPSGVQKERLSPQQMFILSFQSLEYIRTPPAPLKSSACTPLFLQAYLRRTAGACIHTHSMHAVLATLLKGGKEKVWRIRAAEMIKAIPRGGLGVGENGYTSPSISSGKYLGCFEELAIPIIENRSREEDLREELARAMKEFPETCAVLVRRHGVYVWGETVWKAKTQCESLDYLFQLSVEMTRMGLDPNAEVVEVETD